MRDLRTDPPVRFHFEQSQNRSAGAIAVSLGIHGVLFGLAAWLAMSPSAQQSTPMPVDDVSKDIVWLNVPGPGGGGGGGGNQNPEPVRKAELRGEDKARLSVPVTKPPSIEAIDEKPQDTPPPFQELMIPAQTIASADLSQVGLMEGIPTGESQGLGRNGGAGTGADLGMGPGNGPGLGPGDRGGTGDGVYGVGNGVETPRLLREVRPQYTSQAMRAKVQGQVLLECVVLPDGSVGKIRVARSLDAAFGLDEEAIKAARQWRFAPGRRKGEPVAVLVTIAIAFTLR